MRLHHLMVFGGGGAGRNMAKAAEASGRATVVAICEDHEGRRRELQALFPSAMIGADHEALLAATLPDLAHIATPDHRHCEHALAALRAECDVLIEKPLATNLDDALKIAEEARKQAAVAMVHFSLRFQYPTREALRAVGQGEIGKPFLLEGFYVHDLWELYSLASARHTPWRIDPAQPQNVLLGGGCHPIDLILEAAASEVKEVTAYANKLAAPDFPGDDCYTVIMRFADGKLATVLVSTGVNGVSFPYGYFNAYGTEGSLLRETIHRRGESPRKLEKMTPDPPSGHNWEASFKSFVDAVDGLRRLPAPLSVAAKNVAVCEAAIRSAASGRPQKPETVPAGLPWGDLEPAQLKMRYAKGLDGLPPWNPPPGYQVCRYEPAVEASLKDLLVAAGFPNMAAEAGFRRVTGQDESPEGTRLISHNGRIVAATFAGRRTSEMGILDFVCGHPDHSGKGLGVGVCIEVMRYLLAKGYKGVELSTDDWRLPAIQSYLKIGFEPYLFRADMERRWEAVTARLRRNARKKQEASGEPSTQRATIR